MPPPVSLAEMSLVSQYVQAISGVVLGPGKEYLVRGRLGPLLDAEGARSYAELVRRARADATRRIERRIVDAITTQETSFFRDGRPWSLLAHKLLPDHFERVAPQGVGGRKRLDVWCAACSTGQEVYSVAMVLGELLGDLSRYWIRILGTDLSDDALAAASLGRYTDHEVRRGLSPRRQVRHFRRGDEGWQISDELRSLVTFRRLNLQERIRHIGTFDLILCRNVAIYFSVRARTELLDRIADQLRPDGALVVGSTEAITGLTRRFTRRDFHGGIYYERAY